jgi:hypothetical protein
LVALALSLALPSTAALAVPPIPAASSFTSDPAISLELVAKRCIGNRRSYRDFSHCWKRRAKSRRAAAYCSRICR